MMPTSAILAQQLLKGEAAKLEALRERTPDLAARVEAQNDKLTLDEAMAVFEQQQHQLREIRESGRVAEIRRLRRS